MSGADTESEIVQVKGAGGLYRFRKETQDKTVYWRIEYHVKDMAGGDAWHPLWFMTKSDFVHLEGSVLHYDFICAIMDAVLRGGDGDE